MKIRAIILLSAVLFFLILNTFHISSLQENKKIDKPKVSQELYSKINNTDKIRGYVNFRHNEENKKKTGEFYSVKSAKEKFISFLPKGKIKHEFTNKISAYLTKSDIESLKNNPDVESIEIVRTRNIMLQDSIRIINASDSHKLTERGVNLTGKDRTICIIDTGVNYSNSDLGGCYGNNNASSACKIVGGWDYCADNAVCLSEDSVPEDVQGHGTHVSGIAAANGTIIGIAPQAKIVMLKACNATGSCNDDDISASINWCIGNASIYNISVISMSLGSGLYSNYCNDDPLAQDINNAVGKNISVVIASGNDGSISQISAPACVQNATAVGATDKSDVIASYSNLAPIVNLLAPGSNIISICITGNSCSNSGTSMSAPHTAGAIAILEEYLSITGQTKTPEQIKETLNSTGKKIIEGISGYNYSRINVLSALISLDTLTPNVSLISPKNNSLITDQSMVFVCNATDLSLKNMTFYLWNSTGSILSLLSNNSTVIVNSSTQNLSGSAASSSFTVSNLSLFDNYYWNCYYYDSNNLLGYSLANYTLSSASINVSLSSPADKMRTKNNQSFICNASSINSQINSSFYIWNSTSYLISIINSSSLGTISSNNFIFDFNYEGDYYWNCIYSDINNALSFAISNFTISYDLTSPLINSSSPLNNSWQNSGKFNTVINENGSCLYSLDDGINNFTMDTNNNRNFSASNITLSNNQTYNVKYYCNDSAGNLNISSPILFNVDTSAPSISSILPSDGGSVTSSSVDESFQYSVSDNSVISNCGLILNGELVLNNFSAISQNSYNNLTKTLSPGTYTWNIRCADLAGNLGNSAIRTFIVNSHSSNSQNTGNSGSNSGSSNTGSSETNSFVSSTNTFSLSKEQLKTGYIQEAKKQDKIKFMFEGNKEQEHTITFEDIKEDSVNLTLRSEPINLFLKIGQNIKLNLSSPDYYNLYIGLERISKGNALLRIQNINESIILSGKISNIENEKITITGKAIEIGQTLRKPAIYSYWLLFILALLGIIVHRFSIIKSSLNSLKIL